MTSKKVLEIKHIIQNKKVSKNIILSFAVILLLQVFLVGGVQSVFAASGYSGAVGDIDGLIQRTMSRQNVPGAAVAFINDGQVSFYTHGVACVRGTDRVDNETFFYIASLTKAFTALGVQLLEYRGYLSLYDPVVKHIPWISFILRGGNFNIEDLQIRHLLYHTSGLGNATHSATIPPLDGDNALRRAVEIVNNTRLRSRPGVRFEYASSNYIILGYLIATVSGETYESFIVDNILNPLGLYSTKMFRGDAKNAGVLASGHRPSFFSARYNYVAIARSHTPTGYMLSNILDMARWLEFNLNPSIAPYPFSTLISDGHVPNMGINMPDEYYYGLGWFINDDTGRVRHSGFLSNNVSEIMLYEEYGIGVVLFMNSSSGRGYNLAENILAIVKGGTAGSIVVGSNMQIMDIIFSTVSIVFMVVLAGLLAFIALYVVKVKKGSIKFKKPTLKRWLVIGGIELGALTLILITILMPWLIGFFGWQFVGIWMPSSVYVLLWLMLALLLCGVTLGVFRVLRDKKG